MGLWSSRACASCPVAVAPPRGRKRGSGCWAFAGRERSPGTHAPSCFRAVSSPTCPWAYHRFPQSMLGGPRPLSLLQGAGSPGAPVHACGPHSCSLRGPGGSGGRWAAGSAPRGSLGSGLCCRFQRHVLDLTLPWRFANLPNNAKLEMVPASRSREGPGNTVGAWGEAVSMEPTRDRALGTDLAPLVLRLSQGRD